MLVTAGVLTVGHVPHPAQPAMDAIDPLRIPEGIALERAHEQDVPTQRVRCHTLPTTLSGVMTLCLDLDMRRPSGACIVPWFISRGAGSRKSDQSGIGQHLGKETEVQQMHDGMLGAANIQIQRAPVVDLLQGRTARSSSCGLVKRR